MQVNVHHQLQYIQGKLIPGAAKTCIASSSSLELGVVAVVDRSEDEEADGVAKSAPCQHVHEREARRVVGLKDAHHLLRSAVTCLEMRHSILLWQSLARHLQHQNKDQLLQQQMNVCY